VFVVRLIVATRSSGPPASGKIIKEMPGSVASGTPYIIFDTCLLHSVLINYCFDMFRPHFLATFREYIIFFICAALMSTFWATLLHI
jgi:hypothetical protein